MVVRRSLPEPGLCCPQLRPVLGVCSLFPHSGLSLPRLEKTDGKSYTSARSAPVRLCVIPLGRIKTFNLKKLANLKPQFWIKSWIDLTWVRMLRHLGILLRAWNWKLFFLYQICQYLCAIWELWNKGGCQVKDSALWGAASCLYTAHFFHTSGIW